MTTPPLSPAAQAVLDAYYRELPPDGKPGGIAAAIRALVEQVVPREIRAPDHSRASMADRLAIACKCLQRQETRAELLAIAAELDGGNTTTETPND